MRTAAPQKRKSPQGVPGETVECDVCGTMYNSPRKLTHSRLVAEIARGARGPAVSRKALRARTGPADVPTTVLTTCECGRRCKACLPCIVQQMRETRKSTSVCMRCPQTFGPETVRALLGSMQHVHASGVSSDALGLSSAAPGVIGGLATGLSLADVNLVEQVTAQAGIREANMHAKCACHGALVLRDGNRYVLPEMIKDKRNRAKAAAKKATETASKKEAGGDEVEVHERLCCKCLQPCRTSDCDCAVATYRENPYFRQPGMRRLFRNHEITPDMATHFIRTLWDMAAGPVECVCGTWLLRTVDCHETKCACGFSVCFACGYAGYDPGGTQPLDGHFDDPGVNGVEPCAMFPTEYRVWSGGVDMHLPCPCRPSDGEFLRPHLGQTCHGHSNDCKHPEHRKWISLYDANRRTVQAQRFVQFLKGTPAHAAASRELAVQPWYAAYGKPPFDPLPTQVDDSALHTGLIHRTNEGPVHSLSDGSAHLPVDSLFDGPVDAPVHHGSGEGTAGRSVAV
jgi:hypothetical protein